jgi:hydrogenase maturation factor
MIAVLPEEVAHEVLGRLKAMDEKGYIIGEIVERKDSDSRIEWI